jgi:hypothetical protein
MLGSTSTDGQFTLPPPPKAPEGRRVHALDLEPDWHRAQYSLAAQYVNLATARERADLAEAAYTQALEHVSAVVRAAHHATRRRYRRRRHPTLARFLESSMEPSSVLVLAGAMLLNGMLPSPEAPSERSTAITSRAQLREALKSLGTLRTQSRRADEPVRASPSFTSRDLLGYAHASDRRVDRVAYNTACYWSTEIEAFSRFSEKEPPDLEAQANFGLEALERAMWLSGHAERLARTAHADPSLEPLRRRDPQRFTAVVPEPRRPSASREVGGMQASVAARIPSGRGVTLLEIAATLPHDIRILDELQQLLKSGEVNYDGHRFIRSAGSDSKGPTAT